MDSTKEILALVLNTRARDQSGKSKLAALEAD
jgi:hypothetical protein